MLPLLTCAHARATWTVRSRCVEPDPGLAPSRVRKTCLCPPPKSAEAVATAQLQAIQAACSQRASKVLSGEY